MEFFVLKEGTFAIDRNKNFTLFDPEIQLKSDFKGSVFLDVQPFLIKTETDIILLDTGIGQKNIQGELVLFSNLKKIGILPTQITKVVLSHLHKDHVGGMVSENEGSFNINFPNATYYISKPEWDYVFDLNNENYNYEAFTFLNQANVIEFISGDGAINDTISYELTGGHTPFHMAFHFIDSKQHMFFGGDILTMPQQIGSNLLVKSDKFPREANAIRQKIVDRAVAEKWMCLFYHGSKVKYGQIVTSNEGYTVINS